jgi:hypothetical protein
MSFLRHRQIYQSDVFFLCAQGEAFTGFAPKRLIVSMSLRPAIPWRVALQQSPPPLYRPESILNRPAETVNHHLPGAGEFSTGDLGNFQPALTQGWVFASGRGLVKAARSAPKGSLDGSRRCDSVMVEGMAGVIPSSTSPCGCLRRLLPKGLGDFLRRPAGLGSSRRRQGTNAVPFCSAFTANRRLNSAIYCSRRKAFACVCQSDLAPL